jgi:NAD(P)-dependent dehydrogenase (short-subunit alcohol dehydrogenase family)
MTNTRRNLIKSAVMRVRHRFGSDVVKLKVDVRSYTAMKEAASCITQEFGGLDIAVANAGICIWATIEGANE